MIVVAILVEFKLVVMVVVVMERWWRLFYFGNNDGGDGEHGNGSLYDATS